MAQLARASKKENQLCPFMILRHLAEARIADIREYCVAQLDSLSDDDVHFFLPQIISLLIRLSWDDSSSLRQFLLSTCMKSLDFSLKAYWFLHASSEYCTKEQKAICAKLWQQVEMAIVNGKLPKSGSPSPGMSFRGSKSTCPGAEEKRSLSLESPRPVAPATDPIIDPFTLSPMNPKPPDPPNEVEKLEISRAPPIEVPLQPLEAENYLKKHRRCTYFNAQLDLVNFLEDVATHLKQHYPEKRREVLEKNIEHLNANIPRGLYFPTNLRATDPHRTILRIIPGSCVVLDSKEKVPFLLHVEIERQNHCCCDPGISNILESPIKESSMLMTDKTRSTEGSPTAKEVMSRRQKKDFEIKKHLELLLSEENPALEEKRRPLTAPSETKARRREYKTGWKRKIRSPFPKDWKQQKIEYRSKSKLSGSISNWDVQSIIFKAGDDLRQEALAMQLICLFDDIWKSAKIPIKLTPFCVQVTSPTSGFLETVPNSVSLSNLKQKVPGYTSLLRFWEDFFGPRGSLGFERALTNFTESLAGYSLVCYLLQIKDRHNGNILLCSSGKLLHIDFGFLLTSSPGHHLGFETAPFKLTSEMVELMGDLGKFRISFSRAFIEIRRHWSKFCLLCELLRDSGAACACFRSETAIEELKERFMSDACVNQVHAKVSELIAASVDNLRTAAYDRFQLFHAGVNI